MMKRRIKKIYLFLILLFLYLPIFVLIAASFNDSRILGTWKGFTLKWYTQLFENDAIMTALKSTLVLAVMAAFLATVIGTFACLTIHKIDRKSVV